MFVIFFLLSGLAVILLLVSLVVPSLVNKLIRHNLSRLKHIFLWSALTVGFFVLSAVTMPPSTTKPLVKTEQTPKIEEANQTASPSAVGQFAPESDKATYCKTGDVLEHVYNPQRLQVINNCIQVSGTVDTVRAEKDGDYHINIRLDNQYQGLINDKNVSGENGDLVVETICSHTVTQADAVTSCENVTNPVKIPAIGTHVYIVGAYVLDKTHGWMEVHPAWYIGKDSTNTQVTQPQPVQVTPSPPAVTSPSTDTYYGGATALCNDGTYSYAAHHQGACSHHGGVQIFYR